MHDQEKLENEGDLSNSDGSTAVPKTYKGTSQLQLHPRKRIVRTFAPWPRNQSQLCYGHTW